MMMLIKVPHQSAQDILSVYEPNAAFAELAGENTTPIDLISVAMEQELFADAV
ncbi:Twin-arginine translocation pathway signal, partial [Vibrio anguillarum]|nr:Twin-arginine translocation pathway signal [Vibrio anguillarum]